MKWLKNEINTVLHYNMCLIGGMLGVYALLLRGGNFGSAQTGNLIEALISGLEGNVMDMAVRLMALVIYGATLIAVFLVSKYFKGDMRRLCIVIEAAGIVLAGCIPLTADPIVALYPVFFATACQWGIFSGARGYNSATIFSTNNVKQMLLGWTEYIRTKALKEKEKAVFYTLTLTFFHIGVVLGFFAVKLLTVRAAWLSLIPLGSALALTMLKTDSAAGRDTAQSTGRDAAKDTVLKKQPAAVSMKA